MEVERKVELIRYKGYKVKTGALGLSRKECNKGEGETKPVKGKKQQCSMDMDRDVSF